MEIDQVNDMLPRKFCDRQIMFQGAQTRKAYQELPPGTAVEVSELTNVGEESIAFRSPLRANQRAEIWTSQCGVAVTTRESNYVQFRLQKLFIEGIFFLECFAMQIGKISFPGHLFLYYSENGFAERNSCY